MLTKTKNLNIQSKQLLLGVKFFRIKHTVRMKIGIKILLIQV